MENYFAVEGIFLPLLEPGERKWLAGPVLAVVQILVL